MEPIRNDKGQWVIPASKRPDGTWRKERIMKEGYVPQDEVKSFETKASRSGPKGIPGMPPASTQPTKKKTGQSKEKTNQDLQKMSAEKGVNKIDKHEPVNESAAVDMATGPDQGIAAVDTAKRLKSLRKKLREIAEIDSKADDSLTSEQIEKKNRKMEIETEIQELESAGSSTI
mmetsp:Transcript_2607/g.4039  ORF Transcript_2607/g.4039 Transcript_2607/m.4039 type:complete len:174 (+) Transcript_2607:82-603(+)|eukprot:CAMPEP_0174983166 /NCGR_PEP_ID=MMETSP0004_2-20121128/16967_1 /TAXON_ID=420556 /ORGANISM="Ochromonas sp., Strain CCMP1393" /LENGTH=173 /DNA_ID=CAMNT_0016235337 /DNA_START=24 /DNA_END=545 /DNA_ORIENTATION=+